MAAIFLSYRRDDSSSATGRLADKLIQHFGPEHVFRDLDAIEVGADFPRKLREAIQSAIVVLVIIGRDWLDIRGPDGTRRLDQPFDYVRREIETALNNDVTVIPVLVERAAMPSADDLPSTIKPLAHRHAQELSDKRWADDIETLILSLEKDYFIEPAEDTRARSFFGRPGSGKDHTLYSMIGGYFSTLINLILHPKKTLLSTNLGRRKDFSDALIFGLLTTAMATAVLVGFLPTAKTYWSVILIMPIFMTIFALLVSMPLYAAWRLVGARTPYHRIAIPFFYQTAIVLLAVHFILAINALLISLVDMRLGDKVLEMMRKAGAIESKFNMIYEMANALQFGPAYAAVTLVSIVAAVACICWFAASWGSYRQVLELTRWQSCVAFLFFNMLIIMPLYIVILVAEWITSP